MMSSRHGPYELGYFHVLQWILQVALQTFKGAFQNKNILSSDRRLQFVFVKVESLVIVDQHCYGEYVPRPCTHRPS